MIDTIMLFAAGLGSRMKHLTENNPKSLIPILGNPILYYALDLCKSYPFKRIVINTHYLHEKVTNFIEEFRKNNPDFPEIIIVYEEELLETGGAIKNAIEFLGDGPIFTLNTDIIIKSQKNIFESMQSAWSHERMDFLLLIQEYENIENYSGLGDFDLGSDGTLIKSDKKSHYDYIYAGLQILKPQEIMRHSLKIFSLREYYLNSNRAKGMPAIDVKWYHATKPDDLINIEMNLLSYNT